MRLRLLVLGCCVLGLNGLWGCGDDDGSADPGEGGDAGVSADAGRPPQADADAGGERDPEDAGDGASDGGATDGGAGTDAAALPGSLEPDTMLSDLSADEAGELCAALDAELSQAVTEEEAQRLSCTLLAVISSLQPSSDQEASVDGEACEQSVSECLSADLGGETETTCDPDRVLTAAADCSTTVGEYAACLYANAEQLSAALDTFTCEALSDPDNAEALGSDPTDPSSLPECEVIEAECPALLDGEGTNEPPAENGCEDTCNDADDGWCDDGGPGADFNLCPLGTDCTDCGPR